MFAGEAEENHAEPQARQPVRRPRFKHGISRTRGRCGMSLITTVRLSIGGNTGYMNSGKLSRQRGKHCLEWCTEF